MSTVELIESTLFYSGDTCFAFEKLADCVIESFARSQIRVSPKYKTETDIAFSVGELTLTIARTATPLDLTKFIRAKTPGTDFGLTKSVQKSLVNHQSAVVIRVTGPAKAAQTKTRLAVCYITTIQMIALAAPDFIHWAKSESLYTYTQFFSQTGDVAPPRQMPQHSNVSLDAHETKTHSKNPVDWISATQSEDFKLAMDTLRTDTLRRFVFSSSEIRTKRISPTKINLSLSQTVTSVFALLVGLNALASSLAIGL